MPESLPFDRIADRYDETRGGEERGRQLAPEILPRLVPGRTLEIGVGTGLVGAALRARGADVVGVDLSPAMLARAHVRMGSRVAVADALRLPLRAGGVDNALFASVLHVIGDTERAFAEAARVVRTGGRIVAIGAPAGPSPDPEIAPLLAHLPPHRRSDLPDAVAAAGAYAGLRTVESRELHVGEVGQSPNLIADMIETRAWSNLWHIDGAAWATSVMPVVERLRALPDPDQVRGRKLVFHLTVFTH